MNDGPNATWLPNLVGGVSIWKLAAGLNEARLFDGRLLVPETEGSESLPTSVRWNLTGLVSLKEARVTHPVEAAAAVNDFDAALDRVAKVLASPNGGFEKYRGALTVPSAESEDGTNYYFSPESKKLFVINWGASPRSMAGRAEHVFAYEDWSKAFGTGRARPGAARSVSALAVAAVPSAAAPSPPANETKDDKQEKRDKKDEGKRRPWWMWPFFGLMAIALLLVAVFVLKACDEKALTADTDRANVGAEAAAFAALDSPTADDASSEAGKDASADATADGHAPGPGDADAGAATADGGDAGHVGGDAGHVGGDAGHVGDAAPNDDEDDGPDDGGGAGSSGGDAKPVVTLGGAGGGGGPAAKTGPHRRHYQAEAVKWRIATGNDRVSRTEARGKRFDVWLAKGRTFQGVGVEWQDSAGKWHAH
jgi:hypothetical protein